MFLYISYHARVAAVLGSVRDATSVFPALRGGIGCHKDAAAQKDGHREGQAGLAKTFIEKCWSSSIVQWLTYFVAAGASIAVMM